MSDNWIIWHNPRCSTSRYVLDALRAAELAPGIRDYRSDPPALSELLATGLASTKLLRRKGPVFQEHAEALRDADDARILELIAQYPDLLERPVVFTPDGRAHLCRPKEIIHDLIGR